MRLLTICLVVVLPVVGLSNSQAPHWPVATQESKPWAYNWWMASAVDEKGLESQCAAMEEAGLGGFHVIPIYGAKGYEKQYRPMLSPAWIESWNLAVRIARRHGLGVDLTMGSGWCFGGPWVTDEDAASSGMRVKRAGPGGEGFMIDPFSPKAMSNHVARFEAAFGKNGVAERPRAFYHDSYEYFNAAPKHGEDVDASQVACFKVWTDWCKANGYLTRNEAHGSPANWLDLYALADSPETEMFAKDCQDILVSKFASSAAHVAGRRLVSSETCTWMGDHFTETLEGCKRFVDRLFLSGVNHIFYHGCCYSPVEAVWPGWCFYASSELNPRNPIWRDLKFLNAYVTRCQSMFQDCTPDNDTLVYWPLADYRATVGNHGQLTVHNATNWFHSFSVGRTARRLAAEGVCFDYVSDRQLQTLDLSRYARLEVPDCRVMPEKTREAISRFKSRPVRIETGLAAAGLAYVRYRKGTDAVYFLVNTNEVSYTGLLKLSAVGRRWRMDPMTGEISSMGDRLTLESGASCFVVVRPGEPTAEAVQTASTDTQNIAGPWRLEPVCGGPQFPPIRQMTKLSTWSVNADGTECPFSGTMCYSTAFQWEKRGECAVELDLGDVRASARVRMNGLEVGFALMPPYRVRVPTSVLRTGENRLEIEVTSTAENRIRWNDRTGVDWKYFRDANVIHYGYTGPFDASNWTNAVCGLQGPVRLTRLKEASWLSVPSAPVAGEAEKKAWRAAPGTSWFATVLTNATSVRSARWTVSGLGVFDVYLNGHRVGDDFLKPGFTHYAKTKYSFSYDVTSAFKRELGAANVLAAEVGSGWWRDKIVNYRGVKSAFRGVLDVVYADGTRQSFGTSPKDWRCGVAGPVRHSGIFDGEEVDARIVAPTLGEGLYERPEVNEEFAGEVVPSVGAEVCLRWDLAMARGPFDLKKGETLVVDFGQNCAAVPEFRFQSRRGTVLTALPGEMLNDAEEGVRGSDGTKGSVYRANLRMERGMRIDYTFAGDGLETYRPRFTYFGYRYLSLTATDDVRLESVTSVPVTSVTQAMEAGRIETGDPAVNRLIANVRWGMLSNYLSIPTDCPQRNERLGWCADTQVFAETGAYLADTQRFFRKWMRDLCDCQKADGGFTSVAPTATYGGETFNLGWADAGIVVPYRMWTMFGDVQVVRESFDAMMRFVRKVDACKYDFEDRQDFIYADWLSYQKYETHGNALGDWAKWQKDPEARSYRLFLAACYWKSDAEMLAEMAAAVGRTEDAAWLRASAARALRHLRTTWLGEDGLLLPYLRDLQTACLFALRNDVVEGAAKEATKRLLTNSISLHDGCLQTGFLGTAVIMDTLTENGLTDVAYSLLLNHKCPSWLYSVDQGATTVWERWNSYTKDAGFGPVSMNSFNHYAYGAVVSWLFKHAAGIAADPRTPGFRKFTLKPKPDRRLGHVTAEYRANVGVIRSSWRFEGSKWMWDFSIPKGSSADVILPLENRRSSYGPGEYHVEMSDVQ